MVRIMSLEAEQKTGQERNRRLRRKTTTQDMVLCGMFAALIAAGAFLRIPIPVVPFTMQIFFTTMAGNLLGGRLGALSVGVYILLGLVGLPVFTQGGGIWYILKPNFGYLLGFLLATYVTGTIVERKRTLSTGWVIAVNFLGMFFVFAVGLVYYYIICNYVINTPITVGMLFLHCFLLVAPGDSVLLILAGPLTVRIKPVFDKMRGRS